MSVHERRKRPRDPADFDDSAFIEIRHTFGPIRKSVYKVLEFNEWGTSFLVPTSDGYFAPGFPLQYSLITQHNARSDSFGVVRYYQPFNDQKGNAFYKIGVENNPSSAEQQRNLRIRPERLRLAELESDHSIYFTVDGLEIGLPLVDISRYSAAFYCSDEEASYLSVSSAINAVDIIFGDKTLFRGTVIVTRRELDGERYRIVIAPRNTIFDLETIEEQEHLTRLCHSVDSLVSISKKHQQIDLRFKAVVADMRAFLEGYSKIFDLPIACLLSKEINQTAVLDEFQKTFYPHLDAFWIELDKAVTRLGLGEQEHGLYKSYVQAHLHPLMMSAPFCHRSYFKPLGYPGDYEMMRMVQENADEGTTLFSKLVNRHALQNPLARAARNRNGILAERISRFVKNRGDAAVRILSIASGPAIEIQTIIDEYPEIASRIHITLLDQEIEALKYSQDNIYMKRIIRNCDIEVELLHHNIGAFIRQLGQERDQLGTYDLIYIFGLFDYFDDRICSHIIRNCISLLNTDGKLLISNLSLDGHNHRTYMEYAFDWYIIYRSAEQLKSLCHGIVAPCSVTIEEDITRVVKLLDIQMGAQP